MQDPTAYECADVREHLANYLDQELSSQQTRRILQHLENCPDCQARCNRAYGVLAEIRARIQSVTVPDTLLSRLLREIRERLQDAH